MKKVILPLLILTFTTSAFAQNVGIGTTNFTPTSSALLELRSSNSGFLMPRMSLSQVSSISGATEGLLVYQTNGTKGFKYYDGSSWLPFGGGSDNLGTHTAEVNVQLNDFWLSNDGDNEGIKITDDGKVGFGAADPAYQFHLSGIGVNTGPLTSTDQILARFEQSGMAKGAGIQIKGIRALSNVSAFVDLINYDYNVSNEYIMSRIAGLTEDDGEKGAIVLYTNSGGTNDSGLTEKVRITSDGKMGIGVTNPTTALDVNGQACVRSLAGSGTRMVVTDANGNLSTQAIPSGGGGGFGSGTTLTVHLTGNVNNLNVSGVSILSISANSNNREIRGLAGGVAGQVITIVNTDSNDKVKFKKQTGSQQFREDLNAEKKKGAIIMYNGTHWYVLSKH